MQFLFSEYNNHTEFKDGKKSEFYNTEIRLVMISLPTLTRTK